MKKSYAFIGASFIFVLLVGMSACSHSLSDITSTNYQLEPNLISQSKDDLSTDSTAKINDVDTTQYEGSNSNVGNQKDNEKISQNFDKPADATSTKKESKSDLTTQNINENPSDLPAKFESSIENSTIDENHTYISNGEEALQYLKQQIPEGKDDNFTFGVDETLRTDDYGSYYTIQMIDISLRVSGKTGSYYYQVYLDGTYK